MNLNNSVYGKKKENSGILSIKRPFFLKSTFVKCQEFNQKLKTRNKRYNQATKSQLCPFLKK